jgi:hypothetical protein
MLVFGEVVRDGKNGGPLLRKSLAHHVFNVYN